MRLSWGIQDAPAHAKCCCHTVEIGLVDFFPDAVFKNIILPASPLPRVECRMKSFLRFVSWKQDEPHGRSNAGGGVGKSGCAVAEQCSSEGDFISCSSQQNQPKKARGWVRSIMGQCGNPLLVITGPLRYQTGEDTFAFGLPGTTLSTSINTRGFAAPKHGLILHLALWDGSRKELTASLEGIGNIVLQGCWIYLLLNPPKRRAGLIWNADIQKVAQRFLLTFPCP